MRTASRAETSTFVLAARSVLFFSSCSASACYAAACAYSLLFYFLPFLPAFPAAAKSAASFIFLSVAAVPGRPAVLNSGFAL